jgi:hypothetical protein
MPEVEVVVAITKFPLFGEHADPGPVAGPMLLSQLNRPLFVKLKTR